MRLQFDQPFEPPTAGGTRASLPLIQSPPDTVSLQAVNVQNRVAPDAQIPITAEIGNGSCLRANIGHPDYCTELLSSAWNVTVSATIGDSVDSNGKCHGCGSRQPYDLLATAPSSPGEYEMLVQVFGTNTGDMIETETIPITVETDAPENPSTPPEDGDGGGGGIDPTDPSGGLLDQLFGDLDLGGGAIAPLVILVLILALLLFVALSSG